MGKLNVNMKTSIFNVLLILENMKRICFILLILSCIIQTNAQNWKLVWSDEFNYNGLPDTLKWGNETGFIRNNELQYYTKQRIENSRVFNGNLMIIGSERT